MEEQNLQLRSFKKLKQEPSNTENHVNQNVTVHASHKGKNNDGPVNISCKTEHTSSAELPNKKETQGEREKKIHLHVEKKSKLSKTEAIKVYCYTCDSTVTGEQIFEHLFFGQLKCAKCTVKILDCKKFKGMYHSEDICGKKENCPHAFTAWVKDSLSYIQYHMHKDLIIKRFCDDSKRPLPVSDVNRAAADYIKKLDVLRSSFPWKLAFQRCKHIMNLDKFPEQSAKWQSEFGSYSNVVGTTTFAPKGPKSVQPNKSPSAQECDTKALIKFNKDLRRDQCSESDHKETRKHAKMAVTSKNSDRIERVNQNTRPTHRKCQIVKHPKEICPDKCPKCCCTLSPSTLTFNCSNFVMKVVCPGCAFPIHIKLDSNNILTFKKRLVL